MKFPKQPQLQSIYDADEEQYGYDAQLSQLKMQGYTFNLLKGYYSYKDKQPVIFAHLMYKDLQDHIRFFELAAGSQFGLVCVDGIDTQEKLDQYRKEFPLANHLNFCKAVAGMEQIKYQTLFQFTDQLRFDFCYNMYERQPVSQPSEPAKLSFSLRFGAPIPKEGEEGYSPNYPTETESGDILYACRDRRYRQHKTPFTQQRHIILASGQGFGDSQFLKKLNQLVAQNQKNNQLFAIAACREIPVFDDEVRYHEEQLLAEARKLGEGKDDDERKAIEERMLEQKKTVGNLNVYDFELGSEWEGLWLMESDEIGGARKVSLEEAEKIVSGTE